MAVSAISPIAITEASYGTVETVTVSAGDETNGGAKQTLHTSLKSVVRQENVEMTVRSYFKDIPVMAEIARCESQFRHTLADGTVLRGTIDPRDVGVMQINMGYHASEAVKYNLNLLKLKDNMAFARILYAQQGTQPWTASAKCWDRSVAIR